MDSIQDILFAYTSGRAKIKFKKLEGGPAYSFPNFRGETPAYSPS